MVIVRRLIALAACSSLCLPQQEAPTFRATTTLVEFTFVALDGKGNPVTDLKRDEIVISENGQPRQPAVFRFEGGVEEKDPGITLGENVFTNRPAISGGPPRNVTALMLDTLNTAPADQVWVRAQAMRHLKSLPPQTRVAIYGLGSQLSIWHDFTDDGDALRERVNKLSTQLPIQQAADINRITIEAEQLLESLPPPMRAAMQQILERQIAADMEANRLAGQRRLEMSLAHLETIGNHLAGIPGRKSLVWISGGISMLAITGAMGFGPNSTIQSFEGPVRGAAQRLASKGITLYLVDARGLFGQPDFDAASTGVANPRGVFARQRQAAAITADPAPAMDLMADITGGRVIRNTNDMAQGAKAAAADLLGTYTTGFYSPNEPDNKWHRLNVRTTRRGVRLTYAQGYLATGGSGSGGEAWTQENWNAAVMNPVGSTALQLDARCEPVAGGAATYDILIQIATAGLQFRDNKGELDSNIEIAIAQKTGAGRYFFHREQAKVRYPRDKAGDMADTAVHYTRRFQQAPEVTSVRVIVRDQLTGRHGTLDIPLKQVAAK